MGNLILLKKIAVGLQRCHLFPPKYPFKNQSSCTHRFEFVQMLHVQRVLCLHCACLQTVRSQKGFCSCNRFEMEQMDSSSSSCQTQAVATDPRKEYFLEDFKMEVHFQVVHLWISEEVTEIIRWHLII